jgi:hypothetical protein
MPIWLCTSLESYISCQSSAQIYLLLPILWANGHALASLRSPECLWRSICYHNNGYTVRLNLLAWLISHIQCFSFTLKQHQPCCRKFQPDTSYSTTSNGHWFQKYHMLCGCTNHRIAIHQTHTVLIQWLNSLSMVQSAVLFEDVGHCRALFRINHLFWAFTQKHIASAWQRRIISTKTPTSGPRDHIAYPASGKTCIRSVHLKKVYCPH